MDPSAQYALAYALSSVAGLRGILVLFLAALAAHFGFLHPSHGFGWIGSSGAVWALGAFTVLEFLADKVPAVDHAMHAVQTIVKPVAAAIVVGSVIPGQSDALSYFLIAAGAANALAVHGAVATVRAGSTVGTFGTLNPILSIGEDFVAVVATVFALLAPYAAALLAAALFIAIVLAARALLRRRKRAVSYSR